MGHRANFVIIENNQVDTYYSHWGAISIPRDIFFGSEYTINYIKSQKLEEGLLNDIWCEGAVLVDIDQKQLIFWGGDGFHYPVLRKYLISLLQINWEGWGIRWALEGIVDIAKYLQLDVSLVQTDLDYFQWTKYRGYLEENSHSHAETVLTVQYSDIQILDYGFDNYLTELFSLSTDLIPELENCKTISLPQENKVDSGAYINIPDKEIWVWWSRPTDFRVVEKIREYWQGWTVKRHEDGFAFQVELSRRNPDSVRMSKNEAITKILDYVSGEYRFDPSLIFGQIASSLQEENTNVWVNPDAYCNEKPLIHPEEKKRILQRVKELLN